MCLCVCVCVCALNAFVGQHPDFSQHHAAYQHGQRGAKMQTIRGGWVCNRSAWLDQSAQEPRLCVCVCVCVFVTVLASCLLVLSNRYKYLSFQATTRLYHS